MLSGLQGNVQPGFAPAEPVTISWHIKEERWLWPEVLCPLTLPPPARGISEHLGLQGGSSLGWPRGSGWSGGSGWLRVAQGLRVGHELRVAEVSEWLGAQGGPGAQGGLGTQGGSEWPGGSGWPGGLQTPLCV